MPSVGLVLIVLCFVRRKSAIGGWLFYFLSQAIAGACVSVLAAIGSSAAYQPSTWRAANLYLPFLLTNVPPLIASIGCAAVAVGLIRGMTWDWVDRMKVAVGALILALLFKLGIDAVFFPSALFSSAVALVVPCAFLAYLFRSERVRRVFLTKDWEATQAGVLKIVPE